MSKQKATWKYYSTAQNTTTEEAYPCLVSKGTESSLEFAPKLTQHTSQNLLQKQYKSAFFVVLS